MNGTIPAVALAALAFVGGHFVLSSQPVRGFLVGSVGERPFRGIYSVVAAAALAWLIYAYNRAPFVELWPEPSWGRPFVLALMLVSSVFFVGSFTWSNPALVGNEPHVGKAEPGKGIFAVTRHPMLWAFALWGIAHAAVNGDAAAVIFFGGFAVLALGGMAHIDARKRAARDEAWAKVEAVTSAVPFQAMIEGRTRFRFADLGWWRPFAGLVLFAVLLHAHRPVIGLSAFP
jgi:uncharacterized membrane protein